MAATVLASAAPMMVPATPSVEPRAAAVMAASAPPMILLAERSNRVVGRGG